MRRRNPSLFRVTHAISHLFKYTDADIKGWYRSVWQRRASKEELKIIQLVIKEKRQKLYEELRAANELVVSSEPAIAEGKRFELPPSIALSVM